MQPTQLTTPLSLKPTLLHSLQSPHTHRQTAVKYSSQALMAHKGRRATVLLHSKEGRVKMEGLMKGSVSSSLLTVRQMMAELPTLRPLPNKLTSGKVVSYLYAKPGFTAAQDSCMATFINVHTRN